MVCTCVRVHVHACMCAHTYVCSVRVHVCMCTRVCVCKHAGPRACLCACVHMLLCISVCVHPCACMCVFMCVSMHVPEHAYVHMPLCLHVLCISVHACVCVCSCACACHGCWHTWLGAGGLEAAGHALNCLAQSSAHTFAGLTSAS